MLILIITTLLLITIIGIGFISWINNNHYQFTVNNFKLSKLEQRKVKLDALNSLTINVRTAKIKIKEAPTSSLTIDNFIPSQFNLEQKNGKLTINQNDFSNHQIELGRSPIITITVNHDLNDINIDQLNGTLSFEQVTTNKLNVFHHNGTTTATNLKIRNSGHIIKKNGTTNLNNLAVKGLRVSVKTGNFKLNGTKQSKQFDDHHPNQLAVDSTTGQVSINTVKD